MQQDLQQVEQALLTTSLYLYNRIGHDQRLLQFLPGGIFGLGSAGREATYVVFQINQDLRLLIFGDDGRLTCALTCGDDRIWRGHWEQSDSIQIELIPMPKSYINRFEFRLSSMKRSGHHAVLNWLFAQCNGQRICFLNNAVPNANPFMMQNYSQLSNYRLEDHFDPFAEAGGWLTPKDYLLYCYEDWRLEDVFSERFEQYHDELVGPSDVRYDMIILRDPFNCFASRLKQWWRPWMREQIPALNTPLGRRECLDLWKAFAREYLRHTSYRRHHPVAVNYNQWFADAAYRESLADSLGLSFNDGGRDRVMFHGMGSSFNEQSFDGHAEQMQVLDRWQYYREYPVYRNLFAEDRELLDLAAEIFPDLFHEVKLALHL